MAGSRLGSSPDPRRVEREREAGEDKRGSGRAGIGTRAARAFAACLRYCVGLHGVMSVTTYVSGVNTHGVVWVSTSLHPLRGILRQEAFAWRAGIEQAAYNNHERGLREIPLFTAAKSAEAPSVNFEAPLIAVPLDCASVRWGRSGS